MATKRKMTVALLAVEVSQLRDDQRHYRAEFKHLRELGKHNATTLDTILATLKLMEDQEKDHG